MFYNLGEFEKLDKIPKISVIENTRFCIGEKSNDIDLSKRLAGLGDLIVMDAFATSHRAHASTAGVITFIDSLSKSMDKIILGGGIANTLIAAKGNEVGKSLVEESMLPEATKLLENPKIIVPHLVIVSDNPDKPGRLTSIDSIEKNEAIFDVSRSIKHDR